MTATFVALLALTACGSSEDPPTDQDRGASAIAEVTSLEGSNATAEEQAFVGDLGGMSRPYWDNGPEAMVTAYEICASGAPSAAVFDLVDQGWSQKDAEIFADAAQQHLC